MNTTPNMAFHDMQKLFYTDEERERLASVTVGIAGLGGLGSNCAIILERAGIEHFILVDHDRVDLSNLNRQQYWPSDVGKYKTEALSRRMYELNPCIHLTCINQKLDGRNIAQILQKTSLWVESVDDAETKARILEVVGAQGAFVVAASGISGYGNTLLTKRSLHNSVIVGDFTTDCADVPSLAPRVTWASAMLADVVLEHVLRS